MHYFFHYYYYYYSYFHGLQYFSYVIHFKTETKIHSNIMYMIMTLHVMVTNRQMICN